MTSVSPSQCPRESPGHCRMLDGRCGRPSSGMIRTAGSSGVPRAATPGSAAAAFVFRNCRTNCWETLNTRYRLACLRFVLALLRLGHQRRDPSIGRIHDQRSAPAREPLRLLFGQPDSVVVVNVLFGLLRRSRRSASVFDARAPGPAAGRHRQRSAAPSARPSLPRSGTPARRGSPVAPVAYAWHSSRSPAGRGRPTASWPWTDPSTDRVSQPALASSPSRQPPRADPVVGSSHPPSALMMDPRHRHATRSTCQPRRAARSAGGRLLTEKHWGGKRLAITCGGRASVTGTAQFVMV